MKSVVSCWCLCVVNFHCELALSFQKNIWKSAQEAGVAAVPDTDEEDLAIQAIEAVMYFHFCYPTAQTYRSAMISEKCIR